jgi:hypothetical protein
MREKGTNMKPKTDLSSYELDALERAARSARSREVGRLIHAGLNALARFARFASSAPGRLARLAEAAPHREISHV